jgi:hypothetical protein
MMSGKEKLYFLLERIIDARDVTPLGQLLIIDPTNDLNRKYSDLELVNLFTKLEKDEKAVKVLQIPSRLQKEEIIDDPFVYQEPVKQNDNCFHIQLLPTFDNFYNKIQQETEYQKFTGKTPSQYISEYSKPVKEQNEIVKTSKIISPKLLMNRLQGLYARAQDTGSLKTLLLSIYEYIELFDKTPLLEPIWKTIIEIAKEDKKHIVELETKAKEEIEKAYQDIKSYVEKEKIGSQVVIKELKDYEGFKSGDIISSSGQTNSMHRALTYALMTMVSDENGKYTEFCRRFGNIDEKGMIQSWDLSQSYKEWEKETKIMSRIEPTKVWYSWDKLVNFYNIYGKYENLIEEEVKNRRLFNTWGLSMINEEIKSIMEDKNFTGRGHKEYELEEYKIHLQRVNNFTIEALTYLEEPQKEKTNLQTSDKWYIFNEENSSLTVNGKEITFQKDSRKFLFLRTLTQNKKYIYYGEVSEEIDGATEIKDPKNTYYEVCRGIENRLAKVGISDFLIYDFNKAKFNPLYKKLKS